uniref:Uncharacterized protein n=1 Tax=Anopheles culicifacies TaxID=139723 RepID=A0A182MMB3_9DIPT
MADGAGGTAVGADTCVGDCAEIAGAAGGGGGAAAAVGAALWSATDSRDNRPLLPEVAPPPALSGLAVSLVRDRRSDSTARPYSGSFEMPPDRTASSLVTEDRDSRDSLRLLGST